MNYQYFGLFLDEPTRNKKARIDILEKRIGNPTMDFKIMSLMLKQLEVLNCKVDTLKSYYIKMGIRV